MSSTDAAGAVCSAGVAALDNAAFAVSSGAAGVAAPEVPGGGLFDGGSAGVAFGGALVAGAGGVLPAGEEEDEAPGAGAAPFAPFCTP